ncbi:katanin p60 ATPase-containing subunit A-like 2 [Venturia canescens]|uniref:katanin p60 ATPase-containing subunit A-like 2 n=1 Tax=Venturia canescens TaxID=32260 RepID=UPI001C9D37E6|nr:katanin p60 ATPase-containing subunit A-like 2 [Venturia canescens]
MKMEGLSLQAMTNRTKALMRQKVDKRAHEQRRNILYLIAEFLGQQGLFKSLEALTEEGQISENFEICDNIDLEIIFQDYVNFYQSRFNRPPQICKRVESHLLKDTQPKATATPKDNKTKAKTKTFPIEEDLSGLDTSSCQSIDAFSLSILPLTEKRKNNWRSSDNTTKPVFGNEKVLRPLANLYPSGSEWREIAETITQDIVMTNLNVHWDDVHGLEDCKELLKEAVVFPTKYPELFTELFTPWKGILLYGPPGTGKTMLAKSVATECDFTFFNITASSLVSKWRGDSEKYVRVLFELANYHAPSIIFIDEIDWIAAGDGASCSDRSEPARRFRAELLSRLDGLKSVDDSHVILLAATNAPWNLDSALLRRLENHVQVDVPNEAVRREILEIYTAKRLHNTMAFANVIEKTKGYSSADLKRLCKEAWMLQMRPVWSKLENGLTTNVNEWMIKASTIEDCSLLAEATNNILCTANHLKEKYENWKKTLGVPI